MRVTQRAWPEKPGKFRAPPQNVPKAMGLGLVLWGVPVFSLLSPIVTRPILEESWRECQIRVRLCRGTYSRQDMAPREQDTPAMTGSTL